MKYVKIYQYDSSTMPSLKVIISGLFSRLTVGGSCLRFAGKGGGKGGCKGGGKGGGIVLGNTAGKGEGNVYFLPRFNVEYKLFIFIYSYILNFIIYILNFIIYIKFYNIYIKFYNIYIKFYILYFSMKNTSRKSLLFLNWH